ncbi:DUF1002 domain-containing protein [Staphylococcus chromogenes]|uniref:DUF1002 domain-containing protein n=1 Tax=Staphylococcus chromogenes TaxID=46126 RepID=A0AAE5T202_STACR|nr:DUF1002 domain-containing protein [Staphylococcus chromogenes]KDP12594.1 Extracellular protein [Staphylococcus chromogenes MU 970]MBV5191534.1 DUF1002 domain-containing protein [Staphylococcus chromogenes]MBW3131882.1 DUF1002 domain-containing protein [Staphylococcus chromogenes]MCD8904311.1 DUF1002 domain-containing protein [Staphylococcus chromogenes]MCD9071764.1 DUF1002 domain-containing protein [Staphylococcus chromogenes]
MYKKLLISGVAAAILTTSVIQNAEAANEYKPKEDIFIQGADLNQKQLDETKDLLGVDNDVTTYKVDYNDVIRYTGTEYDFIHSSAYIQPKTFGRGVDVEIETPENITRITREQYMNAAITAGIQDATIKIAAIDPVTGEGALTGIYKAYEAQGNTLNQKDIQHAHQEMNDLANISEANAQKEGYSDEALNQAIADMKSQIAEAKQNNQQINQTTVTNIVNQTIHENHLNKILSDNDIAIIQNLMMNVAQSDVINQDPKAYQKQANALKKDIQKQASDKLDELKKLNTEESRNFLQKIWDAIVEFFTSLYHWLVSFL